MSIYIPPQAATGVTLNQVHFIVNDALAAALAGYLATTGGTISGALEVDGQTTLKSTTDLVQSQGVKCSSPDCEELQ